MFFVGGRWRGEGEVFAGKRSEEVQQKCIATSSRCSLKRLPKTCVSVCRVFLDRIFTFIASYSTTFFGGRKT